MPFVAWFWRRFVFRYLFFSALSSAYLSICITLNILKLPFNLTPPYESGTTKREEVLKLGKVEEEVLPEWIAIKALGSLLLVDSPEEFFNSISDPVLRERIKFLLLGLIRKDNSGECEIDVNEALSELEKNFGLIRGMPLLIETEGGEIGIELLGGWLRGAGGFIYNGFLYIEPSRLISMLGDFPDRRFQPLFEIGEKMIILKITKREE